MKGGIRIGGQRRSFRGNSAHKEGKTLQVIRRIRESRRSRVLTVVAFIVVSSGLSALMLAEYANSPGGYAAAYAGAGALVFTVIFAAAGLVLLVRRKTRWLSVLCVASAVWVAATFQAGIKLSYRLGLVKWANDQEVDLLADDGTGYFIYFRPGVSNEAIARFNKEMIQNPSSPGGEELREEIRTFARMPPVEGREVVRIGLQPRLARANILDLLASIKKQPIVFEVSNHPPPPSKRTAR